MSISFHFGKRAGENLVFVKFCKQNIRLNIQTIMYKAYVLIAIPDWSSYFCIIYTG